MTYRARRPTFVGKRDCQSLSEAAMTISLIVSESLTRDSRVNIEDYYSIEKGSPSPDLSVAGKRV